MKWFEWLQKLWESLSAIAGKELGAVIAATVIALGGIVLTWFASSIRWLIDYYRRLSRVRHDVGRVRDGEWPKENQGLWLSEPVTPPDIRLKAGCSPKVLVVANAKGGVGKTTVAANIAARLAELTAASGEKPILLVDLDFQGTLSAMAIYGDSAWLPQNGRDSDATYLISGDLCADRIANIQKSASFIGLQANQQNPLIQTQNSLRIITSHYDLAQAESRVMVEWLIGDRKFDIRFGLRNLLWAEAVASSFSAIIIDCPPRFTTGAIQAFAAATHLLIPTKLDYASREAVVSFARQIEFLRSAKVCWKELKYVGVIATMVDPRANVDNLRRELNDKLALPTDRGGVDGRTQCIGSQTDIHDNIIFRDAGGRGIAYFLMGENQNTARIKLAVRGLARHVAREMNLPHNLQMEALDEGNNAA